MKIFKKNSQILTNVEALDLIEKGGDRSEFELLRKYATINLQDIEQMKVKLKNLGLYEFEIIQLLNFVPTQILHLQLVIEEMEERFDEEKLEEVLNVFQ